MSADTYHADPSLKGKLRRRLVRFVDGSIASDTPNPHRVTAAPVAAADVVVETI